MDRITIVHVRRKVEKLNELVDNEHGEEFSLDQNSGRYRLVRKNGSVDVSPRLNTRQLYDWIDAYIEGIEYAKNH